MKMRCMMVMAVVLVGSQAGYALPVMEGSLALAGIGVAQNGADLLTSTLITADDTLVVGPGLGDYAPVALFASFGPHSLDLTDLPALAASFTLGNPLYGSYSATSATIIQQMPDFLDLFLVGVFTPAVGGVLDGYAPTLTGLRISINQSGRSEAEAVTLNAVPEPLTLTLFGLGLLAFGRQARRRLFA